MNEQVTGWLALQGLPKLDVSNQVGVKVKTPKTANREMATAQTRKAQVGQSEGMQVLDLLCDEGPSPSYRRTVQVS